MELRINRVRINRSRPVICSDSSRYQITKQYFINESILVKFYLAFVSAGLGVDEDSVSTGAGKDFAMIRTASGKVSLKLEIKSY